MSRNTRVIDYEVTRLTRELLDIKAERSKRTSTLVTLYPELLGDDFDCWLVGGIDWNGLHDKAEAIRRAHRAERDKATLKEWEGR